MELYFVLCTGTRCKATRSYAGIPQPPSDCQPALIFSMEDVIDVIQEVNDNWWKVSIEKYESYLFISLGPKCALKYGAQLYRLENAPGYTGCE